MVGATLPLWIPASAITRMTMTNWGAGRTTRLVSSHADRLGARIPSGFPTLGSAIRLTDDSATIGRNGSHRLPR